MKNNRLRLQNLPNLGRTGSLRERFDARVEGCPTTGCWLWCGREETHGYGQIIFGGKTLLAHRVAYELYKGEIPKDLEIDHLCRTRGCVNPDHLEAVSAVENVMRGFGCFAVNARKTHCKRGHEFNERNTGYDSAERRYCKTCSSDRTTAARRAGRYAEQDAAYYARPEVKAASAKRSREWWRKNRSKNPLLRGGM